MSKQRCGYTGKKCTEHDCKFWQQFRGQNPQTGKEEDKWECATVMIPLLLIDNSRQIMSVAAATESTRNVFKDAADARLAFDGQVKAIELQGNV